MVGGAVVMVAAGLGWVPEEWLGFAKPRAAGPFLARLGRLKAGLKTES